jgi:hypothetical protein
MEDEGERKREECEVKKSAIFIFFEFFCVWFWTLVGFLVPKDNKKFVFLLAFYWFVVPLSTIVQDGNNVLKSKKKKG